MASRKRSSVQKRRRPVKNRACIICEKEITPSYKDHTLLGQFLTDRGKILSRDYSGICSKHQRILSREIKRARILGLLPFVSGT